MLAPVVQTLDSAIQLLNNRGLMFYCLGKKLKTASEAGWGLGGVTTTPLRLVRPMVQMARLLQKNLMYIISI